MRADPELLALYALAARLNKTVGELAAMPFSEFTGWMAYFEIDAERRR